MTAKKDITLEEFVEKYIPCWDMIRYNLTSRKLYNRIKPYMSKNFGYTAEEWLKAWNQWKNEEDSYINGWIEKGKASPKYKILRDLCQSKPCVSLKDSEARPEDSTVHYYWNALSNVLKDVSNETEESNIVWDASEYVSLPSAQSICLGILKSLRKGLESLREVLKSHPNAPKFKVWYRPVTSDDYGLSFDKLCLRSDVEKFCEYFEVDLSSIKLEKAPSYCKKCPICATNQEIKTTKTVKEKKSIKVTTKIKKKSSLKKIQSFLDLKSKTNPLDSFSTADISKELSLPSYSCTVPIRELLQKGKVKIVDFKNGNRPHPVYQSIKGSLPSKEIVTEESSLDLMSVTEYCKINDLKPVFIKDILQEAENRGIKGYYTYSSSKGTGGSRGYFYKFKKTDLDRVIAQTLKGEEILSPLVEPKSEPIILPDLQAQERFKPKNLFKKVFDFFGYKLNFNVTVEKKKTVANTGQDLIEF